MSTPGAITVALGEAKGDARGALDRVVPLLFEEWRAIAQQQRRRAIAGTSLDTVGLIGETWLRLAQQETATWTSRSAFLAYTARAMRTVLVDVARRHAAGKRGDGIQPTTLDDGHALVEQRPAELVAVDDCLTRLTTLCERQGRVVECLFFGGLTEAETATALGLSERTVRREWTKARAWLLCELQAS